jgi:hypothetical protein
MASRMLSVPPEVTVPTTWRAGSPPWAVSPPSRAAVMATISASYLAPLGHRSAWRGFTWDAAAYTRLRKATWSSPPWYTAPEASPSRQRARSRPARSSTVARTSSAPRPCSGSRGKLAASPR